MVYVLNGQAMCMQLSSCELILMNDHLGGPSLSFEAYWDVNYRRVGIESIVLI
jgi:hypothetical protein